MWKIFVEIRGSYRKRPLRSCPVLYNKQDTLRRASLHLSVSTELRPARVGPIIDDHVIVRQHPRIVAILPKETESKLVEVGS